MIVSTSRQTSRVARGLSLLGVAALLLLTGCSDSSSERDPSISAEEERSSAGVLEALTVEGDGFTPNGTVLVTMLMAGSGGNASPYVEEEIQADGEGKIQFERRPPTCPQPADYERGSWVSVIARDMTSGISGSATLDPGQEPDCRP